jgi:hypothetical protein
MYWIDFCAQVTKKQRQSQGATLCEKTSTPTKKLLAEFEQCTICHASATKDFFWSVHDHGSSDASTFTSCVLANAHNAAAYQHFCPMDEENSEQIPIQATTWCDV